MPPFADNHNFEIQLQHAIYSNVFEELQVPYPKQKCLQSYKIPLIGLSLDANRNHTGQAKRREYVQKSILVHDYFDYDPPSRPKPSLGATPVGQDHSETNGEGQTVLQNSPDLVGVGGSKKSKRQKFYSERFQASSGDHPYRQAYNDDDSSSDEEYCLSFIGKILDFDETPEDSGHGTCESETNGDTVQNGNDEKLSFSPPPYVADLPDYAKQPDLSQPAPPIVVGKTCKPFTILASVKS